MTNLAAKKVRPESATKSYHYGAKKHLYIVIKDESFRNQLSNKLSTIGYEVAIFSNTKNLSSKVGSRRPDLIIMDFEMLDVPSEHLLKQIQLGDDHEVPVIFLGQTYDIKKHIKAASLGGIAFLTRPIEWDYLVDTLNHQFEREHADPYRVLIVDDDGATAAYFSAILSTAGMKVKVITNPLEIISQVSEYSPDLILLDLYMPECSGHALARVIRQTRSFDSIPIVFLSSEEDTEKQFFSLQQGADEFITKSVKPWQIVATINARIMRARKLRTLIATDSLTGLLNREHLQHRLNVELSRATRLNLPLSIAMIDIDYFKSVNDEYGHIAGDKVLRFISKLLKHRLRSSDSIGRYGGEEFIVILPDTDDDAAYNILSNIKSAYSKYEHQTNDESFSSTFSCGIADFPIINSSEPLISAADKALYYAKNHGRNRIVKHADVVY